MPNSSEMDSELRAPGPLGAGWLLGRLFDQDRGRVFPARHISLGTKAVAKAYHESEDSQIEHDVLSALQGRTGFPLLLQVAERSDYRVLILTRLGVPIDEHLRNQGGEFPPKTVLNIAKQLLNRLENLHSKGYLHLNIRPEHLVMGRASSVQKTVHLISFAKAVKYKDVCTGERIACELPRLTKSTAIFASIGVLKQAPPGPRDDLESMGYLLVYMLRGSLPWSGIRSRSNNFLRIRQAKEEAEPKCLAHEFQMMRYFFSHVRRLSENCSPDYHFLRAIIDSAYNQEAESCPMEFEWDCSDPNCGNRLRLY